MPRHRKRQDKHAPSGKRKALLFAGVAALMLLFTIVLIVPHATQQHVSWTSALLLAIGLWLCSLLLGWFCLRSTRRKRKHRHHSSQEHAGPDDFDDDNAAKHPAQNPSSKGIEDPN
jgi:ABC-type nickel/cobalt efflux system permease component RcnA